MHKFTFFISLTFYISQQNAFYFLLNYIIPVTSPSDQNRIRTTYSFFSKTLLSQSNMLYIIFYINFFIHYYKLHISVKLKKYIYVTEL